MTYAYMCARTLYVHGRERERKRDVQRKTEKLPFISWQWTKTEWTKAKNERKLPQDFHRHRRRRRRHLVSSRLLFSRNVVCGTSSNPFISMGLSRVSEGPSTDDVIDVGRLMPYRVCIRAERASVREYMLLYLGPRLSSLFCSARLMATSSRALSSDLPSRPPLRSSLFANVRSLTCIPI